MAAKLGKDGSVADDMANLSIERRLDPMVGLLPELTPAMTDDQFASAIVRAAIGTVGVERLQAMWSRADRMQAAIERETAAMFGLNSINKRNRRVLNEHERDKPTRERASHGEFELLEGEKFDTSRKGEKVLMDWRARAGGAGDMHVRGQIKTRELAAAVKICELAEYASSSLVGGGQFQEGVDGGGGGDAGQKLVSAAWAAGQYKAALGRLSRTHRFLVEHRVVLGRPMEEVVRLKGATARLGEVNVKLRCERAVGHLAEALDALADVFGLGG